MLAPVHSDPQMLKHLSTWCTVVMCFLRTPELERVGGPGAATRPNRRGIARDVELDHTTRGATFARVRSSPTHPEAFRVSRHDPSPCPEDVREAE